MIARLLLLLLFIALPLHGDAEQDITHVVETLASALSDANTALFLKMLDHNMPGYRKLEQDLSALAGDTDISCTIEVISHTETPYTISADLDWYMVLKSQQDENLIERRRTKVTLTLEKKGKKWIVTSFTPLSIFDPMTVRP